MRFLTRPPTGRYFSPALPSDCFAIDFPERTISPGEGLPVSQTSFQGSGQGCPLLRAANEIHAPSKLARLLFREGVLLDLPLRAFFSPAHPLADIFHPPCPPIASQSISRDVPLARARAVQFATPLFREWPRLPFTARKKGTWPLPSHPLRARVARAQENNRLPSRSPHNAPNVRSKKLLVRVMCCWMSDCKSRAPARQSSLV